MYGYQPQPSQMGGAQLQPDHSYEVQHQALHTNVNSSKEGKYCQFCGEEIASNIRFCPGCGAKMP